MDSGIDQQFAIEILSDHRAFAALLSPRNAIRNTKKHVPATRNTKTALPTPGRGGRLSYDSTPGFVEAYDATPGVVEAYDSTPGWWRQATILPRGGGGLRPYTGGHGGLRS